MLLSPGSAEKVSKIRVKNREPVPSYRMDRNDDEIDAMMVSQNIYSIVLLFLSTFKSTILDLFDGRMTLRKKIEKPVGL